jgi:valyl-tRNA synthetase
MKTKQWFIDVLNIKGDLLQQANKMKWYPDFMKQKYLDWVSALNWDWCISRQRYYGVPFPVWYCAKCGEIILPEEADLPVDPSVEQPKIEACPKCGATEFMPEKDVMDTWMTSSMSPILGARLLHDETAQKKLFPSTLRPQAFEIIRTWLFYTVVKAFYHFDSIPFTDVMISGHGLDDKGQKISKRLNNFVPPEKIIAEYGADSLRFWATGVALGGNLRYNEEEIKKGKKTITKLFNAAKLCLLHFEDKDFSKLEVENLAPEDRWILAKLNSTIENVTAAFEGYQYSKARAEVEQFFWSDFCDNYLEFIKHRLYAENSDARAKAVLYRVLLAIIKMYAPILPFITEEIYQLYFQKFDGAASIHQSVWPTMIAELLKPEERKEFEAVVDLIAAIRKFKSDNQISLGAEIEEFKTEGSIAEKYFDFIRAVGKVKIITKISASSGK